MSCLVKTPNISLEEKESLRITCSPPEKQVFMEMPIPLNSEGSTELRLWECSDTALTMGVLGSQWLQRRETQLLAQGTLLEAEPQFQKQTLTFTAASWVSLVAVGQEQGRQMSLHTRGLYLRAPGGSRDSSCCQGFSWDSHCSRKRSFREWQLSQQPGAP